MSYVIVEKCLGERYATCVAVCPVDCIHPGEYKGEVFMIINPEECIDCGACVPACPVVAIYDSIDSTPSSQKALVGANDVYRSGDADAVAKAVGMVQSHMETHPDLMAIDPKERQGSH